MSVNHAGLPFLTNTGQAQTANSPPSTANTAPVGPTGPVASAGPAALAAGPGSPRRPPFILRFLPYFVQEIIVAISDPNRSAPPLLCCLAFLCVWAISAALNPIIPGLRVRIENIMRRRI
ncbi:hypothetical protein CkaCkLH20_06538 [Colletotrichum karsti]|uniref:Uncharacterized protein n=1 Tax=Colletotrichum karsti TaxID=1095194 RepID=A0A9P6LL16_9PEZI|nr:uncharacterized protein CkaCkLH20_06538 [Colletotrichum karsti]KAF9876092.1 hypothetical protein CkaCkLH20_06538 [Colletotrichum karsti]